MRVRGCFPAAPSPRIGLSIPALVATYPDMIGARPRRPSLHHGPWRPRLYHHVFRLDGTDPKGNPEQRGQEKFTHCLPPEGDIANRMPFATECERLAPAEQPYRELSM